MAVKRKQAAPPVERITDLAMLETITANVEIEWHDKSIVSVAMKTLPFGRLREIERMVADPQPPVTGAGKSGPIYDYNDQTYTRARADAATRRTLLKVADSITLTIPGDTLDERADYLQNSLDARIVNSLGLWVMQSSAAHLNIHQAQED